MGDESGRPLSKRELLDALYREYARLTMTVARLNAVEMATPGALGAWSIKDILAHLIFWTRFPMEEIGAALRGAALAFDHGAIDAVNARAVALYADQPAQAVVNDFVSVFWMVMQFARDLPDVAFEPGSALEAALGDSVGGAFGNNTFEHYALHRADIEAWMAQVGAGR